MESVCIVPDEHGIPTADELATQSAKWAGAPSIEDFPASEIEQIKARDDVLGWVESNGHGEIYLDTNLDFFSPTQPSTADTYNLLFSGPNWRWVPALGEPVSYYLRTAARWARAPYRIKPDVLAAMATNSDDQNIVY